MMMKIFIVPIPITWRFTFFYRSNHLFLFFFRLPIISFSCFFIIIIQTSPPDDDGKDFSLSLFSSIISFVTLDVLNYCKIYCLFAFLFFLLNFLLLQYGKRKYWNFLMILGMAGEYTNG